MIKIGTDIEQISRMEAALARTPRLAARLFSAAECEYCASKPRAAQHYTARFCAKEAFIKALGQPVSLREIEVLRAPDGRPTLALTGRAAEYLGDRQVQVSLAHAGDYATAVVVIFGSEG